MGNFLMLHRKKIGAATLILACIFIGGWVRSFRSSEHVYFLCDRDNSNQLVSSQGNIDWERFHQEGDKRLAEVQFTTARLTVEKDEKRVLTWKWNLLGLGKGVYQSVALDELVSSNPLLPFETMTHSVWRIPYRLIVVPLALISFWLLVVGPRSSAPMKMSGMSG